MIEECGPDPSRMLECCPRCGEKEWINVNRITAGMSQEWNWVSCTICGLKTRDFKLQFTAIQSWNQVARHWGG